MPISDEQLSDPNLKAIYDLGMDTRDDIKELSARFDKHSGEGTDTTHAAVSKRLDRAETRIGKTENKLVGVFSVISVFGALIMTKLKNVFFGG